MTKKPRHFLNLSDFSREELEALLQRAALLKSWRKTGKIHTPFTGKILGMLFEKSSTRTRVSFEAGMIQLGGHAIFLSQATTQLGRGESYEDTARVLSRYLDAIMIRTFAQEKIEQFSKAATIPVINGLTDQSHPCQILADLLTLRENRSDWKDCKVVWLGDGNNVCYSWMEAASIFGFELTVCCPKGYNPPPRDAENIKFIADPVAACTGADCINVDTWVSMGQEGKEIAQKLKRFAPYQLNKQLLAKANKNCMVLHCLPAHRGEEITNEVMDGPQSHVWDQAENRLHVQKALLEKLLT